MFSSNSISNLLGIIDKNLKFTGETSSKTVKNIVFLVLKAVLSYTSEICPKCSSKNNNFSIVKNDRY